MRNPTILLQPWKLETPECFISLEAAVITKINFSLFRKIPRKKQGRNLQLIKVQVYCFHELETGICKFLKSNQKITL